MKESRRRFLQSLGVGTPALLWAGHLERFLKAAEPPVSELGELVEVIPFVEEGSLGNGPSGEGLNGRLMFDLSILDPDRPVVPNDQFYIRTRASSQLPWREEWNIRIHGQVAGESILAVTDLRRRARPMGAHLLECSGNGRHRAFGLMSVAEWEGVPIRELLSELRPLENAWGLLVSGFDRYEAPGSGSLPGASWISPLEELEKSDAFLATGMNGDSLPLDHGFPVRWIMPNWYGCCSIKWVDELALVPDSVEATSQMQEFASRTHQAGIPSLAAEYRPARIEFSAMPVRVELRKRGSEYLYHLLGIAWGGEQKVDRLQLEILSAEGPGQLVDIQEFQHERQSSWTFWHTAWKASRPGRYTFHVRPVDYKFPTRRLDDGYYDRHIQVVQV